jgi:hemerythrin superfamily protein
MPRPTEIAGKAAGKAEAIKHAAKGHTGILKKLAEEHAEVATLLKRCTQTDDPDKREELFLKIREDLLSHAKAEEKIFYAKLEKAGNANKLITQSREDHREVEDMVERLSSMGYEGEDWGELCEELEASVSEHVETEEKQLFDQAKKALSNDELKSLERQYLEAKKSEKQRLH